MFNSFLTSEEQLFVTRSVTVFSISGFCALMKFSHSSFFKLSSVTGEQVPVEISGRVKFSVAAPH